jgi:Protein of unknown function VcgC/VcgE (DUF2780)
MDQIIAAISKNLNLPESAVRSGIGILLNFIKQKAAGSEFEKFVAFLPGANQVMASAPAPNSGGEGGGFFSGLLGKAGGLLGGNLAGTAEAFGAMEQAGVPRDKAAPLVNEFLEHAKKLVDPQTVESLVEQVPALKSLLAGSK